MPRTGVKLIIGFLHSAEMPSITIAMPVQKKSLKLKKPKD